MLRTARGNRLLVAGLTVLVSAAGSGDRASAQSLVPPPVPPGIDVPDWALPSSPTHVQVPPPPGFHRPSVTNGGPIGRFDAQTDVGGSLVPGSASYDEASATYTINSAGYNIWYQRDEFRFLWTKMTGDASLSATIIWPQVTDFHDRKLALVVREDLDDDSRQIMAAQHGNGKVHIAWRADKGGNMTDVSYVAARQPDVAAGEVGSQRFHPSRIGIEKKGDQYQLWVSWQGEPIHPEGRPVTFKGNGSFYVGVGFTSHLPANVLTAKVANVVLENKAGKIQ